MKTNQSFKIYLGALMTNSPDTHIFSYSKVPTASGLLVLSAGFEDRAFEFISKIKLDGNTSVILIKFENDLVDNNETIDNNEIYEKYVSIINKQIPPKNLITVTLKQNCPRDYSSDLENSLVTLPRDITDIWLDISGMPTHMICASLQAIRSYKPTHKVNVIYTSAQSYHPNENEFTKLKEKQKEGVEYLPSSLAKEMSENLILNMFSGQRTNEGQSCLALFAGYEVHRSAGVIENVNPSMLLLLYGKPEGDGLGWRLDLSRQLHKKFEKTRKSAIEEVSTLYLKDSLHYLDLYYEYIYDEYDLTIAPVCSKMHAVAAYLFWETYREVQLIFPLPISYATEKKAGKVDRTYLTALDPQSSLFRQPSKSINKKEITQ